MQVTPETLLDFWFPAQPYSAETLTEAGRLWFQPSKAQDEHIHVTYGDSIGLALRGDLDSWAPTPRGRLALILLLDQLPRCVYRGTAQAFSGDTAALQLALTGIDVKLDLHLDGLQRQFFYMPLQHSEDIVVQNRSVELNRQLASEAPDDIKQVLQVALEYAELHQDIVARFGRFPHRNRLLGRQDTPEEEHYLAADAPTFGQ